MSARAGLLDRLGVGRVGGEQQARAREWLDLHGLPTSRDEAWKYTPIDEILAVLDVARVPRVAGRPVARATIDDLAGDHGGPRLVFVNGVFDRDISTLDLPRGARFVDGAGGSPAPAASSATLVARDPTDGFVALNDLAASAPAVLRVDAGMRVDTPIHLVHLGIPDGITLVHPRTEIHVGDDAEVVLIESFVGRRGGIVTNALTRLVVGQRSTVVYQRVQAEELDALHVGSTHIEQAADSRVCATSVMTGAAIARSAIDVHLAGPGAGVDLDGLYMPTGDQRHDNVVTVDHAAPRCSSTQRFRGVIDHHARGSFTGHVLVRPGALGTDAKQSNRCLLLSPTAQADTRPWLEILADDVRCTHGASVGRLDDDALFYLRSRGIPLPQSRALLVSAFVGEIIDAITPQSLRDRVAAALCARPMEARGE